MRTLEEKERGLERYLECEGLLSKLFGQVDYCLTQCIEKGEEFGCCTDPSYCEPRYGEEHLATCRARDLEVITDPKHRAPCSYHTPKGCALDTHKPPLCVAFICRSLQEHMLTEFGIDYNFPTVFRTLSNILRGNISKQEFQDFKIELQSYVKITGK